MAEARMEALRVGFDLSIKVEFHGAKVGSDGELITSHELDEILSAPCRGGERVHLFSDPQRLHACVIIRGPGWQKDTMPAPLIKTDIFNAGHARGSFGGCIEGEELDP